MVGIKLSILGLSLMGLVLSSNVLGQETLVYCADGSPEGFDPALYTKTTTFDASSRQVYNKLIEFKRGSTTIEPALAESYLVSDDGLEYTFTLRSGVKFHTTEYFTPSRDLNAYDVVFSFERQRLADNPYHKISGGTWEFFYGMSMPDLIESVDALDELTVRFTLTRPDANMMANLAMDFASVLSEEYAASLLVDGHPELLDQRPIGTGPFKFVDYQQDAVIRYQAHQGYWAGKAPVDNLVFEITPDPSVRYQKLKAGECHIMASPESGDLPAMGNDSLITVMELEGLDVAYMAYNTTVAPFDNANVRKALNMAMNKQLILEEVFRGAGKIAKNPIPPTIWSYNEATVDDSYDPIKAKEILVAEGVDKLKMELWAMPVQFPYNPDARRMAELIQKDFAKVGVDVEIVSHEWGEYLKLSKELDRAAAVLLGWTGVNGDPDNFLALLLGCDTVGGSNRAQWCHKPFDDLIQQAKLVSDPSERAALYKEAQLVFKAQAPWATIAHSVVYEAVRKEVRGYKLDPLGGHIFYGVSLAK